MNESGITTLKITINSNSLTKKALAGKFNGQLLIQRAIEDGSIEIVTPDHEDALEFCVTRAHYLLKLQNAFSDLCLGVVHLLRWFHYDTDNKSD
ncbi:MAG: hypothetical protein ACLTA0_05465 [Streptococcus agalactiae]